MFAMSGKAKRWFISKLSTDKNDINTEIISGEWGNFFGAVAVFYVGGTPFLYAQTATSKKKWFVSELSVDKKVVEKEIISGNWDHYYGSVYL